MVKKGWLSKKLFLSSYSIYLIVLIMPVIPVHMLKKRYIFCLLGYGVKCGGSAGYHLASSACPQNEAFAAFH